MQTTPTTSREIELTITDEHDDPVALIYACEDGAQIDLAGETGEVGLSISVDPDGNLRSDRGGELPLASAPGLLESILALGAPDRISGPLILSAGEEMEVLIDRCYVKFSQPGGSFSVILDDDGWQAHCYVQPEGEAPKIWRLYARFRAPVGVIL